MMNELHKDELLDGRYQLIEKRGRGSYGEVWLARDIQLNMDVAVKVYFALDDKGNQELTEEFITTLNSDQQEICNQINRRTEFKVLRTTYKLY